ncbi:MAG: NAD(P)H-hydrate dehydratase [Chloroflexi bacterium]|nr:NAD(P)H-hydrate dehydratase [Chloroflexota bacterium]
MADDSRDHPFRGRPGGLSHTGALDAISAGDGPTTPTIISPRLLRDWPLPCPTDCADTGGRGRVLVVAGAPELQGAAALAATAALRAGAGEVRIGTVRSIAPFVGLAVPEARVYALPETDHGGIDPSAAEQVAEIASGCRATLIGPGLVDLPAVRRLLERLLPRLEDTDLVLDAEAMMAAPACRRDLHVRRAPAILTPYAGELAGLLDMEKERVIAEPAATARAAAEHFHCVVALKAARTIVATPGGATWCNRSGNVSLATPGSGDTLSGIIAGLVARGADPARAATWGVYLHGAAAGRLAKRIGPLGFLARELLAEIPTLMAGLASGTDGSAERP